MAKTRLNTLRKMEYEENGHKDLLNGIFVGLKENFTSPTSDCNSNNIEMPKENMFICSSESIQDYPDFLQDNSEYQWFLDYGYKYNNSHHQSILSLSKSQDLIYYDDMARNIDANVAEVDMDDFNREDIHSVLSSLPNMQVIEEREMFASVTGSMMVKFDFDSYTSPRSNSQEEQCNTSICKSQLLFSPLRESYLPNSSLSVDSLDLSENDVNLMVTCQSNKNNYTIAFEGSTVMTSDDSENRDFLCKNYEHEKSGERSRSQENKNTQFDSQSLNCEKADSELVRSNSINAIVTADSALTTWSKIKESPSNNLRLKRHPSGNNNNTTIDISHSSSKDISSGNFKSLSLPNLFRLNQKQNLGMSLSVKLNTELKKQSSMSSDHRCVKLYDIQSSSKNVSQSSSSASGNSSHNFNLVKLFIKQKSASHEGMSNYSTEQIVGSDNCKNNKNCQNLEKNRANGRITDEINEVIKDNFSVNDFENASTHKKITRNKEKINVQAGESKLAKQISAHDNFASKNIFSDCSNKRTDHNSYYSDESAQENGSNTESAENLTCNCNNTLITANKKLLKEKSIQTSKIVGTNENIQKKPPKVPVYILYPNYSLPNLEFLRKEHYIQNIDFSKVFLRPQKFQTPESPNPTSKSHMKFHGKRPFSVNDIETLKKTGFKHVKDWESLTFLLPKEYKQFLQEIPEIVAQLKDVKNSKEEVVPLFCLSPPPNRRLKKRPNSCNVTIPNNGSSSDFSSTNTQPSSGYRGSSTMLNSNNSYNMNSPRNPSYSYKYNSHPESNSSRRSKSFSQNKNYSDNSDESNENFPPRPPLPKSILRNNSCDNQQYSCKTQKEYANKRYSMVELTDKNLVLEEKSRKRRFLQNANSKSSQAFASRISEQKQLINDVESDSNMSVKNSETQEKNINSNLENDMKRLEELLEISAVFGESVESFTETDMMRLRTQVSKFLTMQKNLEKVSETLQTVDEGKASEPNGNKNADNCEKTQSLPVKNLQTPHNTPEHKKQSSNRNADLSALLVEGFIKPCNCNARIHEFEEDTCKFRDENLGGLRKTVSFAEKISVAVKEHELSKEKGSLNFTAIDQKNSQAKATRPIDLPICEESTEEMFNDFSVGSLLQSSGDMLHKRDLILDVGKAIKKILKVYRETKQDPANICLHHLCPSLYAVLSDGLKEEIDTPFGPIRNSVWSVIEASAQQGPMTQTLNELVQRLNREEIFTEGLIKFNAFIFGLLNARALSGWFSYLRTRDSLLRKYYNNTGLLLLSNTAGAPVRVLVDHLINTIESLSSLQFNLDLMHQTKLLHCSLQNLNCLLEDPSNNDFLTPSKQFMLFKLVQSIQNSLNQSCEGKKNRHVLEDIERQTSDPPVGHLLENNKNTGARRIKNKSRPRSGYDSVMTGQEVTDVASAIKKRWSGVNLNSKLTEAFDKLLDESESDYTDSLDVIDTNQKREMVSPVRNALPEKNGIVSEGNFEVDTYTKEQKKNILINLNKKSTVKVERCETDLEEKEKLQTHYDGQKFKRLQKKWESWEKNGRSPSDSDSDIQSPSLETTYSYKGKGLSARSDKSKKSSCDTNITLPSPNSRISKIPRLVTSPLSTMPTIKLTGNVQRLVSPTSSNNTNQKSGKINYSNTPRKNSLEGKGNPNGGKKINRTDEKMETNLKPEFWKNQTVSQASITHRNCNAVPSKKSDSVLRKGSPVSFIKKPAKNLRQTPRTVRTLTHRLPSDSGYLSFNEGEKLKVVLEVDKAWLLCCRGNQKGLVPKSLVISDDTF